MRNQDIEVIVYRRPNMFAVNENMFNMIGVGELQKFFTVQDYKGDSKEIEWFYPERFLNIVEQRQLITRLESSDYKKVRIVTHSVYIIQCCINVNIAQVQGEILDEDVFQLSWNDCGLPNDGGLGIL